MEFRYCRPIELSLIFVASANAQEHKLTRDQLPHPVAATVDKEARGAVIRGYSTETEHGKRVYEAETLVDGRTRDLQIAADGTLLEVEDEVSIGSLPASVSKSLTSRAKGASIIKVESLTKNGKLVAYEASTEKAGRKGEIQVGPSGEKLKHEE